MEYVGEYTCFLFGIATSSTTATPLRIVSVLPQLHISMTDTSLSRSINVCGGSEQPQQRPEGSRNGSVCTSQFEAERQLFVWPAMKSSSVFCLWCSQAWGQVSDRRSLCTALCPLPESYREAELSCYMEKKKTAGKLNLSPRISSAGW